MLVNGALREAASTIARRDADVLLAHVLGVDRSWLLAHAGSDVGDADAAVFRGLVARRAAHEPLQYVTGRQEFYGLDCE